MVCDESLNAMLIRIASTQEATVHTRMRGGNRGFSIQSPLRCVSWLKLGRCGGISSALAFLKTFAHAQGFWEPLSLFQLAGPLPIAVGPRAHCPGATDGLADTEDPSSIAIGAADLPAVKFHQSRILVRRRMLSKWLQRTL